MVRGTAGSPWNALEPVWLHLLELQGRNRLDHVCIIQNIQRFINKFMNSIRIHSSLFRICFQWQAMTSNDKQ